MSAMKKIKRVANGVPAAGEFDSHTRDDADFELGRESATFTSIQDLRGNAVAVDAMLVAAAGEHHMLLKVDRDAAAEAQAVVEALGRVTGKHVVTVPPDAKGSDFLGSSDNPGIFEQADGGILYVPDAQEMSAAELDMLHTPVDLGAVHYSRGGEQFTVPADFQLIIGVTAAPADMDVAQARRQQARISGPLRERMGLITPVVTTDTSKPITVTEDEAIALTEAARERIAADLKDTPWTKLSQVPGAWLRGPLKRLNSTLSKPLDRALERGGVTMRGYDRVLRSAHTSAAMDGSEVTAAHLEKSMANRI